MRHNLALIINLELTSASRTDDSSHVPAVRERGARDLVAARLAFELAVVSDLELCATASLQHFATGEAHLFAATRVRVTTRGARLFNKLAIVAHVVRVVTRVLELAAGGRADLFVVARVGEATPDQLGLA